MRKEEEIERFLNGEMSAEETKAFETKIASDVLLAKEIEAEKTARAFVNLAGRMTLKEQLEIFESEMKPGSRRVLPLWIKRGLRIAAILIVSFGIYQFTVGQKVNTSEVYETYFLDYDAPSNLRGSYEDVLFNNAFDHYRRENFDEAINAFNALNAVTSNTIVHFYTAMSYLSQDSPDYKKAMSQLDMVLETHNNYSQQARWYKALILLQQNQKDDALELMDYILANQHYKYQQAKEILRLKFKD
ncbi:MAG: hypothetical protein ED556_05080 [Winogradskyella sp.]|uniref:tetratricopeptide repeat protein n=1 Tax=Winogradskyella sp. TaxID=1883156 RepID=UPI000F3B2C1B|nr:hypothetical protein [Winogradskyella sp.]RNC86798.1 MAG: hypothetical protein ED556_05080 [Winogradskyella sp.]